LLTFFSAWTVLGNHGSCKNVTTLENK